MNTGTYQIAHQRIGCSGKCLHGNQQYYIYTSYDISHRQLPLSESFKGHKEDKPDAWMKHFDM